MGAPVVATTRNEDGGVRGKEEVTTGRRKSCSCCWKWQKLKPPNFRRGVAPPGETPNPTEGRDVRRVLAEAARAHIQQKRKKKKRKKSQPRPLAQAAGARSRQREQSLAQHHYEPTVASQAAEEMKWSANERAPPLPNLGSRSAGPGLRFGECPTGENGKAVRVELHVPHPPGGAKDGRLRNGMFLVDAKKTTGIFCSKLSFKRPVPTILLAPQEDESNSRSRRGIEMPKRFLGASACACV